MGSVAKAMKDAVEAKGYFELRNYQRKTIEAYLSGRDAFLSAPTGAGKSLTFELAPYTFDQVSNLNSRGIRASSVGDNCSEEQLEDI